MRFVFIFVILIFLMACSEKTEKTRPLRQTISESVYASGIVKSKHQYEVFATVNGIIKSINVGEGDVVKKGEPIYVIFNDASRLSSENARLAADYADVTTNDFRLKEMALIIDMARRKVENDSLLLVRQQDLWANKIGSRLDLENRELAYSNALNSLESAKAKYKELKKQLNFASLQANKNYAISKSNAKDFTIKSQIDGKIYTIFKKQGELVSPQSPLAVIGDKNNFMVELEIDEADVIKIIPGQMVYLTLDSYKDTLFEARVDKIYPYMNERTRTFKVDASFIKTPPTMYPNLTVEANIIIRKKENVLTIPREYLLSGDSVLFDGKKKVFVKTGLKDYQRIEIIEGLSANDALLKKAK